MPTTRTTKMPADNKMVTTTVLMRMKTKEPGIMMTTTTAELGVAMRTPVAMVAMVNSTSMERSSSQHKSSASKSMSDIASTMSMNSSTAVVSTSRTMPTTAPATMVCPGFSYPSKASYMIVFISLEFPREGIASFEGMECTYGEEWTVVEASQDI